MDILAFILPIVYILVGIVLVWFVVELIVTIKQVRKRAINTIDELQPSIKNIENMVEEIQPTVKKVDPLVDRVTLTVDSLNLEMMRVDEILEDVSQITGTVSKTMNTVDSVTSAPLDIVTSVTNKVRKKFGPKYASEESQLAGGKKEQKSNPFAQLADTAIDAAGEAFKEQQDKSQVRKDEQKAKTVDREEKNDRMTDKSKQLANKILDDANTSEKVPVGQDFENGSLADDQTNECREASASSLDQASAEQDSL